jgi:Aerotolerance regulator N-terminal/von Willebrand factor type A domain
MLFLAPLTLIGLLLVALPVVIHLLARRRARRLDFPSLQFLRETPSFKLSPRRIREPLLLALRAAAIILLVLGLARPLLTRQSQTPGTIHFILMDASLSMKTHGRAEAAKEQARAIINRLASGERASVIGFSSEAKVLADASADKTHLLEAIDEYRPEGGEAVYETGFIEISRELQREPQADTEADIISDFQDAGPGERKGIGFKEAVSRIQTYPVGTELERNAFLIDESVRKSERGVELSATEIVSEMDGRRAGRHTWTLDATVGERSGIEWQTEENGQVTGRLKAIEPDDFDADDERFFAFQPPRDARSLLIETDGAAALFLRAALESASAGDVKFTLDTRKELPNNAVELSSYSLIVVTLHGSPRENQLNALAEYALSGGTVWILLARDADSESLNAFTGKDENVLPFKSVARMKSGSLSFGTIDTDAPDFRSLDESAAKALRAVRIHEGYALDALDSAETLMRWSDGRAACVSEKIGAGRILTLATSIERASSELGASPAFPALASAILRASVSPAEPLSRRIGEPLRLGSQPDASVKITSMEGRVMETKARELFMHPLRFINEPGIYRLEVAGEQAKFVAFNSPAEESERTLSKENELQRRFQVEAKGSAVNESNRREAAERARSLWRYFLAAAFLLMIGELFLSIRRRRMPETIE